MSWIKWVHGLARKPEVMQIAFRLGKTRHEVAGILMELWEWADENVSIDETASGFDPDNCPGSVRLGEQSTQLLDATIGVAGLADALAAVGWIQVRSGSIVFPNFGRHNGKSAKARALDSSRKRAARANRVRNVSGSKPDKTRTRGEEKRRDNKKTPTESSADKPPTNATHPHKLLFAAVAEVTGYDPETAKTLIGSVASALGKAVPPFTPEDVREFARQFVTLCPHAARDGRTRPEPKELQNHIGKLRNAPPPPTTPPKQAGGFKTKAEKDSYILAQQMIDSGLFDHQTHNGEDQ